MNPALPQPVSSLSAVDYDPFAGGELACVVPSTEPQREIWLADQLDAEASLSFNLSVSLRLRGVLATLTDADLDGVRTAVPMPTWGERTCSVRDCLRVILDEHVEHRRYALRDLAVLEGRPAR